MNRRVLSLFLSLLPAIMFSQEQSLNRFLSDSSMKNASVSFCIIDADRGETIFEQNGDKSLIPGSALKLITTASALELLGPEYRFRTVIGYTGTLNKHTGILSGDIIIRGGGDPVLGSKNFDTGYTSFTDRWAGEIRKLGIKRIKGRVISDDSYYDYLPVPAKWLWEDEGNYYGAGAYGLSVFDNTYEIHLTTSSDSGSHFITGITPGECTLELTSWLTVSGTVNRGYVFSAPYSTTGWLAGTIPANQTDFVLKGSITDPPLILAKIVDQRLKASGIKVTGEPITTRILKSSADYKINVINVIDSPPLEEIITVLNHESVNLYAEHLVKELGKVFKNKGSTEAGLEVIREFLGKAGIDRSGMFIEDGSGLSPSNAINAIGLSNLLYYMKTKGHCFNEFRNSLPDAGEEGTLKDIFRDPVFNNSLKAKSGSMTRVKSYAGYLKTCSGKELIFCIIVNNFTGPSRDIISNIENILKEVILTI